MIRYRRLYESENSDIQMYDVVRCAGYEWFVIEIDGDKVTLLAKNNDFRKKRFDKKSNDYKTSEIREHLKNRVLPKLQSANPISTRLYDVDCTDKVWLLSGDEAEDLPRKIRDFDRKFWWLRSPGGHATTAMDVNPDGSINNYGHGVISSGIALRPVIKVHIEDLG